MSRIRGGSLLCAGTSPRPSPRRTRCPPASPPWSGAPCRSDLYTSDPDRAVEFYGAIFGWTAQIAGMVRNAESDQPDTWTTYLSVPDAKAAAAAAGTQVFVKTMRVDDLGTMSVLADPSGAAFGLWQPGTHQGYGRARTVELGGTVVAAAQDSPFGRLAQIADPTGASVKIVGVPAG